jgi:hypothetical protein
MVLGAACSSSPSRLDVAPDLGMEAPQGADAAADSGDDPRDATGVDVSTVDATGVDASPATGAVVRWVAPFANLAAAATSDTLAVAYSLIETDAEGARQGRLMLQLLDQGLEARGEPRELDRGPSTAFAPLPTIATDGVDFVVCWSPRDQVSCFRAQPDREPVLFVQTLGLEPTIVFHAPSWALAYVVRLDGTYSYEARVTRLSSEGAPLGTPAAFPYDNYFSAPVPFVATPSGYALLVGKDEEWLYRLADDLGVRGTPVDLGVLPWAFHALAATDEEAALAVAVPYGNVLVHIRGNDIVLRQERGCGDKTGCAAAVAPHGSTFAVAWWPVSGPLSYFDDIDHAGAPNDQLAVRGAPIALIPFRSGMVIVTGPG